MKKVRERQGEEEGDEPEDDKESSSESSTIRLPGFMVSDQGPQSPDYLKPVARKPDRPTRPLRRLSKVRPKTTTGPQLFWLVNENSGRRVTLPTDGGLIFGRFDPNVGIPPDIDLSFEDRGTQLVSRRHASVFAENGKHTIEDLGSKSGVFLNGEKIDYGPSRLLKTGDAIWIGRVKFRYKPIPTDILRQARTKDVRHILRVTASDRRIMIEANKPLVMGRSDSRVSFVPDVDLSGEGEFSRLVSRRHALIQWRFGQPYLEDLGSGFGTRLRGELLTLGQATPMVPGDHIWLAGCVVSYDVEIQ